MKRVLGHVRCRFDQVVGLVDQILDRVLRAVQQSFDLVLRVVDVLFGLTGATIRPTPGLEVLVADDDSGGFLGAAMVPTKRV